MSSLPLRVMLAVLALVALAGCKRAPAPADQLSPTAKLFADLSLFAQGEPLSDENAQQIEADVKSRTRTVEAFVDELLARDIGGRLARDLLVGASVGPKDRHPVPFFYTLAKTKDGALSLRGACAPDDVVEVDAWWGARVKVCKASYRPDVMVDGAGRTCGASVLDPRDSDVCGCGPMLVFCTENERMNAAVRAALTAEVTDTAAWVVNHDLPIESLFTMNETVRGPYAEYAYRRARVVAGEDARKLFPIVDVGPGVTLLPRHEQVPGQHAGVLSTPAWTYSSDALRGILRNTFDWMWCAGASSSRVTTEAVLALKTVDLRVGDGWKDLAAMNVCTDCHARLDYGMQFFWGYPSSTMGIDFRPSQALSGSGPLYGRNIHDARGSEALTPAGFARLAIAQPEFGACMTKKVVEQVFNGSESSADFAAVRDAFDGTHKLKAMLRTAMLRYADKTRASRPVPPAPAVAAAPATEGRVALSPALRKLVHQHCRECHDEDEALPLTGDALAPRDLALMLDRVGFGAMPKDAEGLSDDVRRAFVRELSSALFPVEQERAIAIAHFGDGMRGSPVHRYATAMKNAGTRGGGAAGSAPGAIESGVPQSHMSYTPGLALSQAITAVRSCKGVEDAEAKARCIERATAPIDVIAGVIE